MGRVKDNGTKDQAPDGNEPTHDVDAERRELSRHAESAESRRYFESERDACMAEAKEPPLRGLEHAKAELERKERVAEDLRHVPGADVEKAVRSEDAYIKANPEGYLRTKSESRLDPLTRRRVGDDFLERQRRETDGDGERDQPADELQQRLRRRDR